MPVPKVKSEEECAYLLNVRACAAVPFPQRDVVCAGELQNARGGDFAIGPLPLVAPPLQQRLMEKQNLDPALRVPPGARVAFLKARFTPRKLHTHRQMPPQPPSAAEDKHAQQQSAAHAKHTQHGSSSEDDEEEEGSNVPPQPGRLPKYQQADQAELDEAAAAFARTLAAPLFADEDLAPSSAAGSISVASASSAVSAASGSHAGSVSSGSGSGSRTSQASKRKTAAPSPPATAVTAAAAAAAAKHSASSSSDVEEGDSDDEDDDYEDSGKRRSKKKTPKSASRGGSKKKKQNTSGKKKKAKTVAPSAGAEEGAPAASGERRRTKILPTAVEVLSSWFVAHVQHPYPTESDKESLMRLAKVDSIQVNNWFTNTRKRFWYNDPSDKSKNYLSPTRLDKGK